MNENEFDVIVVGGGPSGSSASFFCAENNLKTLLLEKEFFPRDKICGDAESGKTVGILKKMNLWEKAKKLPSGKTFGVILSAPNGYSVEIPYPENDGRKGEGMICPRKIFDDFLFQNSKKKVSKCIEGFTVTDLIKKENQVIGVKGIENGKEKEFKAKIVIGADGANSVIATKMNLNKVDAKHQCIASRAYYDNVEGLTSNIEIHFINSVLPGYFWIFPCGEKKANVGVGILTADVRKQNKKVVQTMLEAIEKEPLFKNRFQNAKRISEIKGWTLPLASKKRKLTGNGFVLCGDAGSLIDPFTGEGMGNGMTSGFIAAQVINEAIQENNLSEKKLSEYEKKLWEAIGDEVKTSYLLQRMGKIKPLLNFVIKKAATKKEVQKVISGMLANEEAKKEFYSPLFYLKLLFS
jgi:menaquinone-9 beta-reductase